MEFEKMLQKFLKQSQNKQKDLQKRNGRRIKNTRYKLSANRFKDNNNKYKK